MCHFVVSRYCRCCRHDMIHHDRQHEWIILNARHESKGKTCDSCCHVLCIVRHDTFIDISQQKSGTFFWFLQVALECFLTTCGTNGSQLVISRFGCNMTIGNIQKLSQILDFKSNFTNFMCRRIEKRFGTLWVLHNED